MPTNEHAAYAPPTVLARCPFSDKCEDDSICTGYNDWGFGKVEQGKYTAASRQLNKLYCTYFMTAANSFTLPTRVEALKQLEQESAGGED